MEKKEIEKVLDELPFGVKASLLGAADLNDAFRHTFKDHQIIEDADKLLQTCGMDFSSVTEGMTEEEGPMLKNLVAFLLCAMPDFGAAGAFVVLIKRYFLPMAERKRALEKMIIALGGEKDGHSSENA